jgi:hypothetical protein
MDGSIRLRELEIAQALAQLGVLIGQPPLLPPHLRERLRHAHSASIETGAPCAHDVRMCAHRRAC